MSVETTRRVFIYGSCVSRDTLEYFPAHYRADTYVARHSLLSDGTDASYKLPADLKLSNAFQNRMLRGDWRGNPLDTLRNGATSYDLILWDIFDERHGVHWFTSGEVVTRSIDLVASEPAMNLLEPGTHVPFGAEEHYEEWAAKATELVGALASAGALERLRLLNVPWAETNTKGAPTPTSMGISAGQANQASARYYTLLEGLGVPTVQVPAELAVADPNHQWGEAPFHYTPATYEYIQDAVLTSMNS